MANIYEELRELQCLFSRKIFFNKSLRNFLFKSLPPKLLVKAAVLKRYMIEYRQLSFLKRLADPEKVSLDIGAHYGTTSYLLAKNSRHVYAYEPNPECYNFLVRASIPKVTVKRLGVSDNIGQKIFYLPQDKSRDCSGHGSFNLKQVTAVVQSDYQEYQIATTTIDHEGYRNIGFIKIDVEGHENYVIRGALETLTSQRPNILMEIRGNTELIAFLRDMGYNAFIFQEGRLTEINDHVDICDVIFLPK